MEKLESQLVNVIIERDANRLLELLAQGANASQVANNGRTAIGQAAFLGYADLLEPLLRSCAMDDNTVGGGRQEDAERDSQGNRIILQQTPDGMDALQWEEEIEMVPTERVDDEWSKLYKYYAQMLEKTGFMFRTLVRLKEPNCLDSYDFAPIHYAAREGRLKCLELLIEHGAPVDLTNSKGLTPLHMGVVHLPIISKLLAKNANPNAKTFYKYETPLHLAVRANSIEVVKLLLESGADVNAMTSTNQTPLIFAANAQNLQIVNVLLENNAMVNTETTNGETAIYFAITRNSFSITERLFQYGARCLAHHHLLHTCVQKDWIHMVELLIRYDRDSINYRNYCGWSAVYIAIFNQNAPILAFLLKNGALLNCQEWFRKELQILIQNSTSCDKFRLVADILLQYGVDIDTPNYFGETPLIQAIMADKFEIAEYLIKEGANVNTSNIEYFPDSLLYLRQCYNINLINILLKAGMHFHCFPPYILNIKPSPWPNPQAVLEDFLGLAHSRPFTLQQLCRIYIRDRLINRLRETLAKKQHDRSIVVPHIDGSMLKYVIRDTGLPPMLQRYLYDFPDIQPVKDDLSVRFTYNPT